MHRGVPRTTPEQVPSTAGDGAHRLLMAGRSEVFIYFQSSTEVPLCNVVL